MVVPGGKKKSSAVPFIDIPPPNHDTGRVFHGLNGISFTESFSWWSPDVALSIGELLHGGFVGKQHLLPLSNRPFYVFLGKCQTLAFHSLP